jgi:hypothetical protein
MHTENAGDVGVYRRQPGLHQSVEMNGTNQLRGLSSVADGVRPQLAMPEAAIPLPLCSRRPSELNPHTGLTCGVGPPPSRCETARSNWPMNERPSFPFLPKGWLLRTGAVCWRTVGRLVRLPGGGNTERLVWQQQYPGLEPRPFRDHPPHPHPEPAGKSSVLIAEADGNRTRRGTFAPPPILKACPTLVLSPGL